jgi:dipeptidyl aminopeptidase/acylaminoacyl peptidase
MEAEDLELRDGDVSLPAVLYRPDGAGPSPAVVVAPGGLARGDVAAYAWAGERLAAAGFVALILTYRDASPYGDVDDVGLALERLEHEAGVDGGRIVAFGHSRGGLAVLRAAAFDARIKAVISIASPADLAEYVRALTSFAPGAREGIVQFMGGAPDDVPEHYESVRALRLAGRIRQPVLLIHGSADMRVPPEHSVALQQALAAAGNKQVNLEVVPGMGHFLELGTLGYQFDRVASLAADWLAGRDLKPAADAGRSI